MAVEAPHREITLALLFGNIFVNNFTELTKTRLVPVDYSNVFARLKLHFSVMID